MSTTEWEQQAGMTGDIDSDNVQDLVEQAETSEDNAAASATAAASSATSASTSANAASNSASSASTSAATATTKASEASTSATNAATSATAAQTAQTAAETAETNAETAQTAAEAAETAAEAAKNAALGAQIDAETAETNAAASATSAASSATTATTQASNASTSATAAAASATAASASETAASASETAAAASETAAAASESAAAASASAAATSASNASTSETNASASATAAQAAQAAAESAQEAIDGTYLGALASDPTVDGNGDAVTTGDWYFNTGSNETRIYNGSTWQVTVVSVAGLLTSANNLSDVASASTARTNLGLGTAATTASTDYATAAQGALADSALQSIPDNYILNTGDSITGNLSFGDNDKAQFGASNDLQIYHDGSNSYISDTGSGSLRVRGANYVTLESDTGEVYAQGEKDGPFRLYYNDSLKLATTSTGINVTGTVAATSYTGDGSALTGIDALPSQSGESGNYLTTDGSTASWAALDTDANSTTKGLYEMSNTISANYSITSGNNAMSAGPISIDSGVSVTIPSGSVWTIV